MIIFENKLYNLKGTNEKRSTIQDVIKANSNAFIKPYVMKQ